MGKYRSLDEPYVKGTIKEYEYWTLLLNDDRRYLGRAYVWLVPAKALHATILGDLGRRNERAAYRHARIRSRPTEIVEAGFYELRVARESHQRARRPRPPASCHLRYKVARSCSPVIEFVDGTIKAVTNFSLSEEPSSLLKKSFFTLPLRDALRQKLSHKRQKAAKGSLPHLAAFRSRNPRNL